MAPKGGGRLVRACRTCRAAREQGGNPISGFEGQIAAICRSQAATLATRNTKDFIDTGVSLIDPWQETTA